MLCFSHKVGGPVHATKFIQSSSVVSCGDDGVVRIWDLSTGEESLSLAGHTVRYSSTFCFAFTIGSCSIGCGS